MSAPALPDTRTDLAQRRRQARRLAWLLGSCAVLLYLAGLLIPR